MTKPNVSGPIIVWENHGYNSWMPKSYPDMRSALIDRDFPSVRIITQRVIEVTSSRGRIIARAKPNRSASKPKR